MGIRKIFYPLLGVIPLSIYLTYSQKQPVEKIQLPVIPQREDIVSSDLACKIASVEVQKKFGKGVMGNLIVAYDLNGSVRAYIVPFKMGADVFPPEEEIIRQMKEAKRLLSETKKELAKIRETSLKKKAEFKKTGDRVFLEKNPDWKRAEERVKEMENKCWGIGEYATIIVSGRKDLAPILKFSNTLPYYYTYRKLAEERAKELVKASSTLLTCFYYGGSVDQIFEFKSSTGEKVWIAMFPLRVVKLGEIITKKLEVTEEEKKWIQEKWDRVMQEVQNEK